MQIEEAAGHAAEPFDAGKTIIEHVSNSSIEHPLFHLPTIMGVDLSVTKHVLMLWLVSAAIFFVVTAAVRRYLRQDRQIPSGFMNALEAGVDFIRESIVRPNVGDKWVDTWTPLLVSLFIFIRVTHGGVTATGNFNVTAALATITFFTIIIAGARAHGFVKHWKNMVPHGLPLPVTLFLIPIEIMGMLVRPFALTMRLAANMTGGHIAILAILSFVFIFNQQFGPAAGMGVGVFSLVLAVLISALEIIVVLVQAYVFTLLSAVFIGMAIHAHH
jgi:F-type H+-transporting ATPase subunit a